MPQVEPNATPANMQFEARTNDIAKALSSQLAGVIKTYGRDLKKVPDNVTGYLVNPDGDVAAGVVVWFKPTLGQLYGQESKYIRVSTTTGADGLFRLPMPNIPAAQEHLVLAALGENGTLEISLLIEQIVQGSLGTLTLTAKLNPYKGLGEKLSDVIEQVEHATLPEAKPAKEEEEARPTVVLGEGENSYALHWIGGSIDSFSYNIFYRLVEPGVNPPKSVENGISVETLDGVRPRLPISCPLDVLGFRKKLETNPNQITRLATLGLGYIVRMHQEWQPSHLSLGDLLYSLPLAPGEEQRIAIIERHEELSVQDQESMSAEEVQDYISGQDTSTDAVFHSALTEHAEGGSSMSSYSRNASIGASTGAVGYYYALMFGTISGGFGWAENHGEVNTHQDVTRNLDSATAQQFHESLSRHASGRRRASRVGIRLARANEREQVTTKIIANHNHSHALTMQYWEVLRNYDVVTQVDDVQLVCLVPLELVRFLPEGKEHQLNPQNLATLTPEDILDRYDMLIRCYDVILPWQWKHPELYDGLRTLKQFASYLQWDVQKASSMIGITLKVTIEGVFLPFERIYLTLVLKNGTRIGPMPVTIDFTDIEKYIEEGKYSSRQELVYALAKLRQDATQKKSHSQQIQIPGPVIDDDIAALEITRQLSNFSYKLVPSPLLPTDWKDIPNGAIGSALKGISSGAIGSTLTEALSKPIVTLTADQLSREVGQTLITSVLVKKDPPNDRPSVYVSRGDSFNLDRSYRLPFQGDIPTLTFQQLQRIERVFQHVVENTMFYSRAVWLSLSPEERAIMLEGYTVANPAGDEHEAAYEIPLLNCVANQVVGFVGSSMIMPFSIPPVMADRLGGHSNSDVQSALLRFHRAGFVPPRSTISLPTHGMLGEAVLGMSNASEKIDLTRFWNWQDAPIDHADSISPSDLNQANLLAGAASAPDKLMTNPPANLISINSPAPTALPDLIGKITATPTSSGMNLTGLDALKDIIGKTTDTAATARQQVVEASQKLAEKALDSYIQLKTANSSSQKNGGSNNPEGQAGTSANSSGQKNGESNKLGGQAGTSARVDNPADEEGNSSKKPQDEDSEEGQDANSADISEDNDSDASAPPSDDSTDNTDSSTSDEEATAEPLLASADAGFVPNETEHVRLVDSEGKTREFTWISQLSGGHGFSAGITACMDACKAMLKPYGIKPGNNIRKIASTESAEAELILTQEERLNYAHAILYIINQLHENHRPVIVGVTWNTKIKTKNSDGITDHFVVIYDMHTLDDVPIFTYAEPGTEQETYARGEFYYDEKRGTLVKDGTKKEGGYCYSHRYEVTQVRQNQRLKS